jgi:DNA-directed RNA polymerase beta subunit
MMIEVQQGLDETGEPEEFSWDLFPLVDASQTLHLGETGLPKVGTRIRPGMIIVGKIGKSRFYDPDAQPTALEIHGLDLEDIRNKYGKMWNNTSFYASQEHSGIVRDAFIECRNGSLVAVVEIQ